MSFENEDYVELTITIKKSTLEGLRALEDKYCCEVESMLSIEADKLLEELSDE